MFGLLAEGEQVFAENPVGRVLFHSGLRLVGKDFATLDPEGVVTKIETLRVTEPPGPALILLDLQFGYGRLDPLKRRFNSSHPSFGNEVVLPVLAERYGYDDASSSTRWISYPVVILSGRQKEEVDESARRHGARGMIPKQGWTDGESACLQLQGYLEAHGLIPDPKGVLVGHSLRFLNVLSAARRAARGPLSVLIQGESGTGKELLARYIHEASGRPRERYGVYHAAGRGDELQEDELFGHWAGAFTGADRERTGLLEELTGGAILIDEIGDVALRVQNALMRPLQERVIARIGRPPREKTGEIALDLKFLFATNKDLDAAVEAGRFKADLLERIREVVLTIPPLRERAEDISLLAPAILKRVDKEVGAIEHRLSQGAIVALGTRPFRAGNIRELRNTLLRAALDHPNEPNLMAADFEEGPVFQPKAMVLSKLDSTKQSRREQIALQLIRFDQLGPDGLSLSDLRSMVADLRGVAPSIIVWLLEVACEAARLDGRCTLQRIMSHFWGLSPNSLSPQESRRALVRLLKVEWGRSSVASEASRSTALMNIGSLRKLIESVWSEE